MASRNGFATNRIRPRKVGGRVDRKVRVYERAYADLGLIERRYAKDREQLSRIAQAYYDIVDDLRASNGCIRAMPSRLYEGAYVSHHIYLRAPFVLSDDNRTATIVCFQ